MSELYRREDEMRDYLVSRPGTDAPAPATGPDSRLTDLARPSGAVEAASDNPVVGGEPDPIADKMARLRQSRNGINTADGWWLLDQLEAERALVLTCYDQIRALRARLEAAEKALKRLLDATNDVGGFVSEDFADAISDARAVLAAAKAEGGGREPKEK